jgi:vitamin K-dependent gamma-carboxylase
MELDQWKLFFRVMFGLSLCFSAGFLYYLSAALFCVGFLVLAFQDLGLYLNHFYLIVVICFMFCFIPANTMPMSVDAQIGLSQRSNTVPYWTVWVCRMLISV